MTERQRSRSRLAFLASVAVAASALANASSQAADTAVKPSAGTLPRAVAEKIALARVRSGRILEGELEVEHERLVWSFDIARPKSAEITEVQIDAHDGSVVSVSRETPAEEQKERG